MEYRLSDIRVLPALSTSFVLFCLFSAILHLKGLIFIFFLFYPGILLSFCMKEPSSSVQSFG